MLFHSLEYLLFVPLIFIIYWVTNKAKLYYQNLLILFASYFFYANWDFRFLLLIIISSLSDYFIALKLTNTTKNKNRKLLLFLSVFINISILFTFKYFNFFISSFSDFLSLLNLNTNFKTLNIILPIGISFYTFQTLSYTIDVYNKKVKASKNIIAFLAFVAFFPQLVAGPIERAKNLLPQFLVKKTFNYNLAIDGLRQMLYGFFKKIVIADNCAIYVDMVFANPNNFNASSLFCAAILFSIQIYADFSAYSNIAIGTAKLFGFRLQQNFNFPYFARDIAEFWRKWHISLTTWFRDYVYIPLGGSKKSKLKTILNIFIIFLISAFWHGANYTFLIWGLLNAFLFLPLFLTNKNRKYIAYSKNYFLPDFKTVLNILKTFLLVSLTWVFFRAETVAKAILFIKGIFSSTLFSMPQKLNFTIIILIIIMMVVEWISKYKKHAFENMFGIKNTILRWLVYFITLALTFYYYQQSYQFIYFQF